jgi:hypothetical protein
MQNLFTLKKLRKAILQIDTSKEEVNEITFCLQRVFYNLQFSEEPVKTLELMNSFGIDFQDPHTQHDVQEFNCYFFDILQDKLKDTNGEGLLNSMFGGEMVNYIECTEINYESVREECFLDIQLNVKGCKTIQESFDMYIESEILEGENAYETETEGKQRAKKGVRFKQFPPVLQLHLKRFEFQVSKKSGGKVNDRFEFSEVLDLNPYVKENEEKSQDVDNSIHYSTNNIYDLHSILVHRGNPRSGHYYAFIKPDQTQSWIKFNDNNVNACSSKEAIDNNFGGSIDAIECKPMDDFKMFRSKVESIGSAYMLVYIRKQNRADLLCDVTKDDIPFSLIERLNRENEVANEIYAQIAERKNSLHLFIFSKETIQGWNGLGICPTDNGSKKVPKLKENYIFRLSMFVPKETSNLNLLKKIGRKTGIPYTELLMWRFSTDSHNHSFEAIQGDKFHSFIHSTKTGLKGDNPINLFVSLKPKSKKIEGIEFSNILEHTCEEERDKIEQIYSEKKLFCEIRGRINELSMIDNEIPIWKLKDYKPFFPGSSSIPKETDDTNEAENSKLEEAGNKSELEKEEEKEKENKGELNTYSFLNRNKTPIVAVSQNQKYNTRSNKERLIFIKKFSEATWSLELLDIRFINPSLTFAQFLLSMNESLSLNGTHLFMEDSYHNLKYVKELKPTYTRISTLPDCSVFIIYITDHPQRHNQHIHSNHFMHSINSRDLFLDQHEENANSTPEINLNQYFKKALLKMLQFKREKAKRKPKTTRNKS